MPSYPGYHVSSNKVLQFDMKDLSSKDRRVLYLDDNTLYNKFTCSLFSVITSKPSLASLLKKQLFYFPCLRYFLSFNPLSLNS